MSSNRLIKGNKLEKLVILSFITLGGLIQASRA
jgi:hypothetical protein